MKNLEVARRKRRWSQTYLGHLPTVRISPSLISLCEQGRGLPNDDQRERLARALNLPPDLLLEEAVTPELPPVVEEPVNV